MPEDVPVRGSVTRADLAVAVQRLGYSSRQSHRLVQSFFRELADGLATEGVVRLQSFGVFEARDKAERVGRNPATGESMRLPRHHTVVFRPSKQLRQRLTAALGKE